MVPKQGKERTRSVSTRLIDGKAIGQHWLAAVAAEAQALRARGTIPRVALVMVGDNAASQAYIRRKIAAANSVGIEAEATHLRADDGEAALFSVLRALAHDPATHGIIVQTPLPEHYPLQPALDAVPWMKDVDGLCGESRARRMKGQTSLLPATPAAIVRLLTEHLGFTLRGLDVAVVGKGLTVGAPLREILEAAGAKVIGIDRDTPHPQALCRQGQVVVAACGVAGLITREWCQPGACVLDVGISRSHERSTPTLQGDVQVASVDGYIGMRSPVPGGIGPLTVASLLGNVVQAARLHMEIGKGR
jgi:methylenetetrahydrofolate dehydrogenase (NADP+)/methenyltetrahydrofolate cyclohydrolase